MNRYRENIGTLGRFQANVGRLSLSGADALRLYEAVPEPIRASWDRRQLAQIDDSRYVAGQVGVKSYRKRKPRRPAPVRASRPTPDDWRDGVEVLASIEAEDYLEILVPESEPNRGRCHCPLPDHEDNNPSATYNGSVWYCHSCSTGGGIFTLAAAITGLRDRGDDFGELRKWVAERMLGAAA